MLDYEYVKAFNGEILGKIRTSPNGDKVATTFTGEILGRYNKALDRTTTFTGVFVARGDATVALIYQRKAEEDAKRSY